MEDKKHRKVRDRCHYTGEYRGAAYTICNLKYSVPKKVVIAFHNGCNYDYHFTVNELAEEFKKQITCLGENTEKCIIFTVPIEKEVTRIHKNGEEITKKYLTCYNLLIAQGLWQAYYQIVPIIFLKEFVKLNLNTDKMIKNVKLTELNIIFL